MCMRRSSSGSADTITHPPLGEWATGGGVADLDAASLSEAWRPISLSTSSSIASQLSGMSRGLLGSRPTSPQRCKPARASSLSPPARRKGGLTSDGFCFSRLSIGTELRDLECSLLQEARESFGSGQRRSSTHIPVQVALPPVPDANGQEDTATGRAAPSCGSGASGFGAWWSACARGAAHCWEWDCYC